MIAFSVVLVSIALLASMGGWLLASTLWTAGERDARWIAAVSLGVLMLFGAVALLASKFSVLQAGLEYLHNPLESGDQPSAVSFEGEMPPVAAVHLDHETPGESQPERSHAPYPRVTREVSEERTGATPAGRPQRAAVDGVDQAGPSSSSNTVGSTVSEPTRETEDRHWPATRCISVDAASYARPYWEIRNVCNRPVAVVFATCTSFCESPGAASWHYVNPALALRPAGQGTAQIVRGTPGRAEHLACFITAPTAVSLLGGPGFLSNFTLDMTVPEQIELTDECMRVALSVSRFGASLGRSPLQLFR